VLDDAPTPLLTVDGEGRVELANKAARRLFVRHRACGSRISAIMASLRQMRSRGRRGRAAAARAADDRRRAADGDGQRRDRAPARRAVRVVAVQPIQGELNAVEIAAQSDLIRVLTHEIMNSMTPVTSLAHTAAS
jgi:two-component system nitrogen regulation sensor histidine kinase NtrY